MKLDKILNLRSIQLAKLAKSSTRSNPKVGAIIFEDDGKIASEGYHSRYGGPHAEANAISHLIAQGKYNTANLSILVSLEPCNHYGKTPPCVDLIKKHMFKRAVISTLDPDPRMSGKSLGLLNNAGIKTDLLSDKKSSDLLLKAFKVNVSQKRPYIYLKVAMDKDGIIGDNNKRLIITDKISQVFSHKIRSEVNAIIIGRKTAELDNPILTTRMAGGVTPLRVIIDLKNSLDSTLHIFNDENSTLYICGKQRNDLGDNTIVYPTNLNDENLLFEVLQYLYEQKNVGNVLVEGGAETINTFIKIKLWDELVVFKSSQSVETDSPIWFTIPPARLKESIQLKSDILSVYTPLK